MTKSPSERFVELAIEGGWKGYLKYTDYKQGAAGLIGENSDMVAEIFLDKTAWEAVGKALGWVALEQHDHAPDQACHGFCVKDVKGNGWLARQHRFIDHLAEGNDINSALEKIL